MFGILQRYVLRETLGPTLLGLIVFTFMLFTAELFDLMDALLRHGVSLFSILKLFSCIFPTLLAQTIPMAILVGVLMGFGRLSGELEIMAMRTSGVNLTRLMAPVMAFAGVVTVILIMLNISWFPALNRTMKLTINQIEFEGMSNPTPGTHYDEDSFGDSEQSFDFFYTTYDKNDPEKPLKDCYLVVKNFARNQYDGASKNKTVIAAKSAKITAIPEKLQMRFIFYDGEALSINPTEPDATRIMRFNRLERIIVNPPSRRKKPKEFSVGELNEQIRDAYHPKQRGAFRVERIKRFSVPVACLAFAWFGIPLAILIRPRGKAASYCFTIGLIFFYYILLQFGEQLAQSDSILVGPVVFSPNIILFALGAWLWKKTIYS
ncbi:LptF/LptG family permease [Candidatus Sumerlaeota bacterium]|nr:LptF/LptG family permease [Candidatus Sumerlaeota bacterium]